MGANAPHACHAKAHDALTCSVLENPVLSWLNTKGFSQCLPAACQRCDNQQGAACFLEWCLRSSLLGL